MSKRKNELFESTDLYQANLEAAADPSIDTVVNQGGTSSGKTYSIVQVLFTLALQEPKSIITIVGQDIPNLKVGALRDAQNNVSESPLLDSLITNYHKSDRIYTLGNESILEFKSYGNWQDAKSGKRDYLFINEANWPGAKPIYTELSMRTRKTVFLDYNPNAEFWVHTELVRKHNTRLLISDHRHNTFLDQRMHDKIEGIEDPDHWKVYARGLTGKIEGLIFKTYKDVEKIPEGANLIGTGLDFGFTNDVTAVVDVYMLDGELWLDERLYERGLVNVPILGATVQHDNISDRLKEMEFGKRNQIIADSAEQKSIKELSIAGWHITGAKKGPESIRNGIDILKRYKLNVTWRSGNIRKELNSYKWAVDKRTGETLNEPVDFMNHAIDAIRYVALEKLGSKQRTGKYSYA